MQESMKKTVLITGATGGIGRALAFAFRDAGYRLALNARNEQALRSLGNALGTDALILPGDVGDAAAAEAVFRKLEQARPQDGPVLDVLINNAGVSYIGLLQEMQEEDWERLIRTNLSGVFHMCKGAIPHMLAAKKGSIINISSVWGRVGASCEAAYSASKGAVNSLTRALAKELAPSGIAVNALALGAFDTPMNACFSQEELRELCEEIPAGRLGDAKEAAALCVELAASSNYLTGQIIGLDGGWY